MCIRDRYYGDIVRSNNKGVAGSFFYDIAIDPNGGNNPTRCGNANNTPVSYTHLDVYKRQIRRF